MANRARPDLDPYAAWERWRSEDNWHRMINGTKFDVRRHNIVRNVFMENLVADDRVKKVMDNWKQRYSHSLAEQISQALKKDLSIKSGDERWEAFRDAALNALPQSSKEALVKDGIQLTLNELKLPWASVLRDLIDLLAENVMRNMLGYSEIRSIEYSLDETEVELVGLDVPAPTDEQMKALLTPGKRGPDDARLAESGRWLYQYMVEDCSIYAIAKEYHEKNHHRKVFKVECDCRDNRK